MELFVVSFGRTTTLLTIDIESLISELRAEGHEFVVFSWDTDDLTFYTLSLPTFPGHKKSVNSVTPETDKRSRDSPLFFLRSSVPLRRSSVEGPRQVLSQGRLNSLQSGLVRVHRFHSHLAKRWLAWLLFNFLRHTHTQCPTAATVQTHKDSAGTGSSSFQPSTLESDPTTLALSYFVLRYGSIAKAERKKT